MEKIFIILASWILIVVVSICIFKYYHPTHFAYNDRFIIGNTQEKIIEKYQTKCDNILKIIDEEENAIEEEAISIEAEEIEETNEESNDIDEEDLIKYFYRHFPLDKALIDFKKDIIQKTKCNVIFHCAAYKHVPMMEENQVAAVQNNVFGTQNLLDAAFVDLAAPVVFVQYID